jgi:peptidoglycan/xylan/chitin deacetylase (PgdA/CDA1 family)
VVFHHISAKRSPFTDGIDVTITPERFETTLKFLSTHYVPVHLEDVITDCNGRGLPPRALLVTFDDAYASVSELAAPHCQRYKIPAVFFTNAAFLDNRRLAPDNLICYVANVVGMEKINAAAKAVRGRESAELHSISEIFNVFFPSLSLDERNAFLETLTQIASIDESRLAREANLYMTSQQLRNLHSFDFEIGNHTFSHTHGRSLSQEDLAEEIDKNKEELEVVSRTHVRSFSQPYGSSRDLTPEFEKHLKGSGHEVIFLSESVANCRRDHSFRRDRISTQAQSDDALFLEIEILPRLRAVRNRLIRNSGLGKRPN